MIEVFDENDVKECLAEVTDSDIKTYAFYLLDWAIQKRKVKAIPIFEGTTNGNVIEAMFPNLEGKEKAFEIEVNVNKNKVGNISVDFWNAPYKQGDENEVN